MEQMKFKKSDLNQLIKDCAEMRRLLEEWPARAVMTEFEKKWNRQRMEILKRKSPDSFMIGS